MNARVKLAVKAPEAKKENQISRKPKTNFSHSKGSPVDQILFLQRTIGNQAVGRLIKSGALQAKLRVSQPGDIYEQEADRVAEQVMRMPDLSKAQRKGVSEYNKVPSVRRKCTECEEELQRQPMGEEEEVLQTKEEPGGVLEVSSTAESQINIIKGGGQPLSESVRAFFEPRFGHDFSQVKVHDDSKASESAQGLNAKAYTVGRDLVFEAGQYAPETTAGKKLLAHELTHVLQQRGNNRVFREYLIQRDLKDIEKQLKKEFTDPEDPRLTERRRRLNIEFQFMNPSEATVLLDRLINPKIGDIVPEGFQKLSRYTRSELLRVLFSKLAHVEAEILHTKLAKEPENEVEKKLHARFKDLVPESKNRKELLGVLSSQFAASHRLPLGKKIWIKLGDENFNIGSISPDHDCKVCKVRGTNRLGVDWSAGNNFMELRGDISGHTSDVQYDFKRTVEVGTWKKVGRSWQKVRYDKTGTDDDLHNSDEDLVPEHNHIYVIDGPGPNMEDPIWPKDKHATEYVYQANFTEWVNVKVGSGSWTRASDDFEWHSITTLEKVNSKWQRKRDGLNEILPGYIPVIEPL